MVKRSAGSLAVETLLQQGAECIFSVSGDSILPIYDACKDVGLPIYHVRQEAAAVTMADGWARTTGRPGVCLVTFGAGVANCVGGMLNASLDSSPVVLISGRSATWRWGQGSFAEIDATTFMRPLTKWSDTVIQAERIPEYIQTAFRFAQSGRPGPAFLQIPSDVLGKTSVDAGHPEQVAERQASWQSQADPTTIAAAAEWIRDARRPILIAGSGVWWSQARDVLNNIIEVAQIPSFACYLGRGTLSHASPYYFGLATPSISRVAAFAASHCDLIILAGADFDFELGFGRENVYNPDAKVIQVAVDSSVIGRNRRADLGLVGDVKLTLEQLSTLSITPSFSRMEWLDDLRKVEHKVREDLASVASLEDMPIHPARLCHEIRAYLGDDAVITLGGGNIYSWGRTILDPRPPGRLLAPHHTWSLGCAVSLAVAAKTARPEAQVLALSGDGSLGYDVMEMDTAVRYKLPIVCVVANDSSWSMIGSAQAKTFGPERVHATSLLPTAYHEIVQAIGGYGELVTDPEEIRPALERAFNSGIPACVNVHTAPVHSPDLISWYG